MTTTYKALAVLGVVIAAGFVTHRWYERQISMARNRTGEVRWDLAR